MQDDSAGAAGVERAIVSAPGRAPKVLVLGVRGLAGVRCADWPEAGEILNIADFDVVVVAGGRLTAIMDMLRARFDCGETEEATAEAHELEKIQSLVKDRLLRVLRSNGRVFGICPPYRSITLDPASHYYSSCTNNHAWIPLPITMESEPGDTLSLREPAFERYFQLVKNWSHVFSKTYRRDQVQDVARSELEPKPEVQLAATALACDRQEQLIGMALHFMLYKQSGRGYEGRRIFEKETYLSSGPLYLLPPPTAAAEEMAIRVILEDFCGVEALTKPPAFVEEIRLPGEDELAEAIEAQRLAVAKVEAGLKELQAQRSRKRGFLALVYEKGISGLQEVARQAFEEMGLQTRPADPEVSDEFYVSDGNRDALVEVRGHRKSAQMEDIRQVIDNTLKYEERRGHRIKGVLLVNAWNELPPDQRETKDRVSFPDNVVRRANEIDIALVSGPEILKALCAVWDGTIDGQAVFAQLLAGRGVVNIAIEGA